MTCIYCNGETDTGGACVAQCYWSQNKRFESSKSARWNTRPIEDELRAEITRLKEENHALDQINRDIQTAAAHLDEVLAELEITDELLKEATETIGAVVACCTYNSNEDAKIGIYGIDHKAFTKIDQFITHYNDAVSAGKVSVDVKPVQRPADPSLEEDE